MVEMLVEFLCFTRLSGYSSIVAQMYFYSANVLKQLLEGCGQNI